MENILNKVIEIEDYNGNTITGATATVLCDYI